MGAGHLIKRSVTLKGHRTSVALEEAFWAVLDDAARQRGLPLSQLIVDVDLARGENPLSSALRLTALEHAKQAPPPPHKDSV